MRRVFDDTEFASRRDDARAIERMYRADRRGFADFIAREAVNSQDPLVRWWDARLNYRDSSWGRDLGLAIVLGAACWVPLRALLGLPAAERLAPTYLSTIFFAFWGAFLLGRGDLPKRIGAMAAACLVLAAYFIALGDRPQSQSITQAAVHGYAALWLVLHFLSKPRLAKYSDRDFAFMETTGEVVCWSLLLGAAGAALSGVTVALFGAIKIDIADRYMLNIGSLGAVIIPFLALHLSERFADFRMSTVLARIVRPLASLAILSFIAVSLATGNRPYEDRNVFILGNIVLVAMIALVFYAALDRRSAEENRAGTPATAGAMNLITGIVALAFDVFILSATLYRIFTYGITPNKLAVLGMNLLLAGHMAWLLVRGMGRRTGDGLLRAFGAFMPVYLVWTLFVIFVMPALFGYR